MRDIFAEEKNFKINIKSHRKRNLLNYCSHSHAINVFERHFLMQYYSISFSFCLQIEDVFNEIDFCLVIS